VGNDNITMKNLKTFKEERLINNRRNNIPSKSKYILPLSVFLILALSISVFADLTAGNINGCGLISSAGVYNLTASVNSTVNCFKITSSNVILNGNGFVLTYNSLSLNNTFGIYATGNLTNITIMNFAGINDYNQSGLLGDDSAIVFVNNLNSSTIYNNNITTYGRESAPIYRASNGISLVGTSLNNNISSNRINANNTKVIFSGAIKYFSTSKNDILNNNILNSSKGNTTYYLGASSNNIISNNIMYSNVGNGLRFDSTSTNDNIINNNIQAVQALIIASGCTNDNISNNIIKGKSEGLLFSATNCLISNNNITSTTSSAITYLTSSPNNIFNNNFIEGALTGIQHGAFGIFTNNTYTNNNITGDVFYAIEYSISTSILNNFTNNYINSLMGIGFSYESSSSSNDILSGNTITSVTSDIYVDDVSTIKNLTLSNQIVKNYSIASLSDIIFATGNGSILLVGMNGTGTNLFGNATADVVINNNFAYTNSAIKTGLNESATITFYNLPFNTGVYAIKDGATCSALVCSTPTLLSSNGSNYNYRFNVTSWSYYMLNGTLVIPSPTNAQNCVSITSNMGNFFLYIGTIFAILATAIVVIVAYSIKQSVNGEVSILDQLFDMIPMKAVLISVAIIALTVFIIIIIGASLSSLC
jgi:hypothetical protein